MRQHEPGLVIAPHPFFPASTCLGNLMHRHVDLFDAVEYNGMFTASLNFNRAAERWASMHEKPIVGNGDVHRLRQLGTTYSLVNAQRDPDSICDAVARGQVRVEAHPHSAVTAVSLMADLVLSNVFARREPGLEHLSARRGRLGAAEANSW